MSSEKNANNLIIKTMVVLVIFSLFVTSVFMAFFPSKIAKLSADVGLTKMSITFEKASYKKTEDINTLSKILSYEIYTDNSDGIANYGMEMLNHKHYADYVEFLGVNDLTSMSYNVYCETYIMDALYEEGRTDEAIAVLSNSVTQGYEMFGAGILLCKDVANVGDGEFARKMLDVYEKNFNGASEIKGYNITLEALVVSENLYPSEYAIWQDRLESLNNSVAK